MLEPIIETERLILRKPVEADWREEIAFWQSDRCQFVGGQVEHQNQVWRMFATIMGHWVFRGYGFFTVIDRKTDDYIGHIGAWYPEGWPDREIGWTITNPKYEGSGYAYEAAMAARDHAYNVLGWDEAISLIDPQNTRSIRLAERMGAVNSGKTYQHDAGHFSDIYRHPKKEALS